MSTAAPIHDTRAPGPPAARRDTDDLAIATADLTRTFTDRHGRRTVVDSLDLAVPRGVVYGFLGPNGSGKSTTMKMLLGLMAPTRGSVSILGQVLGRATRAALMARTGSLIESPPGYGHLTGAQNMRIVQLMLGLDEAQVRRALELVGLTEHKDRLVRTYSLGMKQRLGIAIALAREPDLLILDEPTNGLDPSGIEQVRNLLVTLAGQGVSIMVSSHLLDEVDRMASVLGILSSGRLVFQGSRESLRDRSAPDLVITTSDPAQAHRASALLASRGAPAGVVTGEVLRISALSTTEATDLVRALAVAGVEVVEVRRQARSLEEVFMDLTGRAGAL